MADREDRVPAAPLNGAAFEYPATIRYSETDHNGVLTLPALVNHFQDCSTWQSETLGIGMRWLAEHRRAWVLSHWQIVVDRYPELGEEVTVGTFARRFRSITANRNFYLRDASGRLIARADSTWAFMDLDRGRPVRPTPEHYEPYGVGDALDMPAEERHVSVPEQLSEGEPVRIRRHHIDTNGHTNNAQYVLMALDLVPRELTPRRLRVDYRRSALLGDVLVPRIAEEDGRTVVVLDDAKGEGAFAVVEFS